MFWIFVFGCAVGGLPGVEKTVIGQVVIQPESADNEDQEPVVLGNQFTHDSDSKLMSPPRDVVRPLIQAQRMMDEGRPAEAAERIGSFLESTGDEDYLVPSLSFPGQSISLRQRAEIMLGSLDAESLAAYELRFGVQAAQRLKLAVADRDFDGIADVMNRFFFTAAGAEAALLLGHHELDRGHPVTAAACFQRVLSLPSARRRFDPELSVLAATCWTLAGNTDKSVAILEDLKTETNPGWIQFHGNRVPLFAAGESPQAWLANLVGESPLLTQRMASQWLLPGGDAQHNALSESGLPTFRPKWKLPVSTDPEVSKSVSRELNARLEEGTEWVIPAVSPLVVGTSVIMKNENGLVGVNAESGKRIWSSPARVDSPTVDRQPVDIALSPAEANEINLRLWGDSLAGQFSSNGDLVFAIPEPDGVMGETRIPRLMGPAVNRLTAVQLSRQGEVLWEVGGESGGVEPELAGVFFLGAPLPLGSELFAIGRVQEEIRLVVLGQTDGRLHWSQQLSIAGPARPTARTILQRSDGISPAYADGILVCPTGNGAVVALDAASHLFLWGIEFKTPSGPRRSTGSDWIDPRVMVSGDKVVLAAMENGRLMVFDLETGKAVTSFGRSGLSPSEPSMLACVEGDAAILVGRDSIQSISLKDRSVNWQQTLSPFGPPSGRGFAAAGSYFFPTVHRFVVQVDLATGSIRNAVSTDQVLGNLISLQGLILSQGVDWLTCYESDRRVRQKLELAKAELSTLADLSPQLLGQEAQLRARAGEWEAALHAMELADTRSDDGHFREELLEMVIQAVRHDVGSVPEIIQRYQSTFDQADALRLQCHYVDYLIRNRQLQAALVTIAEVLRSPELVTATTGESGYLKRALVAFDQPLHRADQDAQPDPRATIEMSWKQWVAAQLTEIRRSGSESERSAVSEMMAAIAEQAQTASPEAAFHRLAPFGWQLYDGPWRIELARSLMAGSRWLPAEMVIESLLPPTVNQLLAGQTLGDSDVVPEVDDDVLELWLQSRQAAFDGDALTRALDLVRAGRVRVSGSASLQWLENWDSARAGSQVPSDSWKRFASDAHEVQVEVENTPRSFQSNQPIDVLVEATGSPHWMRERWIFWQQSRELEVFDRLGNSRARFPIRRTPVEEAGDVSHRSRGRLRIHGNLGLFDQGNDLVAIDLTRLSSEEAVIWNRTFDPAPVESFRNPGSVLAREIEILPMRISGARILEAGDPGHRGICVLDGTELHCLDIMSGESRWIRRVGAGKRKLLTDDQHAVVVDLQNRKSLVIDLATGRLVANHELPTAFGTLWSSRGTAAWTLVKLEPNGEPEGAAGEDGSEPEEEDSEGISQRADGSDAHPAPGSNRLLGLYDSVAGDYRWQRRLAEADRVVRISGGRLAILSGAGRIQLVDGETGEIQTELESGLTETELERVTDLGAVDQQGIDILLFNQIGATVSTVNLGSVSAQKLRQTDVIFSGLLVGLDRATGKPVWPRPIRLEGFSFFPNVADDSPWLMLHRRARLSREDTRSGGSQLHHVIGIDVASGRLQFNHTMAGYSIQFLQPARWDPDRGELSVALSQYFIRYRSVPAEDRAPSPVAYITEDNPLPRELSVAGPKHFDPAVFLPSNALLLERARQFEQALPDLQRQEQEQMNREILRKE